MKPNWKTPLFFLAPALILLLVFTILPIFTTVFLSLTNFNIYSLADWSRAKFIGIGNYAKLLQDSLFWKSLFNTFYFVIMGVPATIALSLLGAVLINSPLTRFKKLFRIGFFIPFVTDAMAIAIVWRWIVSPDYGILNWLLSLIRVKGPDWLGDPRWAMLVIVMVVVWRSIGYDILLFLAGLQNIPYQLYEAAEIDGVNLWQRFRYITLPLVQPTTFFVTVTTIIGYLQLFSEPFAFSNSNGVAGPLNSLLSVVYHLYNQGFRFFNIGYASAIANVLFVIIFIITLAQIKLRDKELQY